jgi:YhcH/YjgK/YiaL family protein
MLQGLRRNFMIVDQLGHWKKYFTAEIWETIFAELAALNEDTPEGEKKIRGDEVILKVFSYETASPESEWAEMESHRRYLDIHTTLTNAERIAWHPVASLKMLRPYNDDADEIIYCKPDQVSSSLLMTPGLFALFGPEDAHMPRLHASHDPQQVKKAAMKIRIDAVGQGYGDK